MDSEEEFWNGSDIDKGELETTTQDAEVKNNQKFFTRLFSATSNPSPQVDTKGRTRVPPSGGNYQYAAYLVIKDGQAIVLDNWPQTNKQVHGFRHSAVMCKGFSELHIAQQYADVCNRMGVPEVFNIPKTQKEAFVILRGIKPGVYLDR